MIPPDNSPHDDWWHHFFSQPEAFELGQFPNDTQTDEEVAGLQAMLDLQPGQRVADICCGAGRHLLRLAALGLEAVGLDRSEMMLGLARQAREEAGLRAGLVLGDARALPFRDGTFDVALNLFNSFGYFEMEEENERLVREMARLLRPGGKLLLDTRNRQFQILFAPYWMELTLPDGRPAATSSRYLSDSKRLVTTWHHADTSEEVYYRASIRLYGLEELDEMMARAGLQKVAVYGNYEGAPFEGFHRQLLYLARRP